jgi:hypothetical protein
MQGYRALHQGGYSWARHCTALSAACDAASENCCHLLHRGCTGVGCCVGDHRSPTHTAAFSTGMEASSNTPVMAPCHADVCQSMWAVALSCAPHSSACLDVTVQPISPRASTPIMLLGPPCMVLWLSAFVTAYGRWQPPVLTPQVAVRGRRWRVHAASMAPASVAARVLLPRVFSCVPLKPML